VGHHAGIDVSLDLSSVCVIDARGKIVREAKVASEPDPLVSFFKGLGFPVKLIGLEAGPSKFSRTSCHTQLWPQPCNNFEALASG
jgi:hypothetical protein